MPDPIKNEETENRINSLCLYGVPNITVLNRCAHCPGAARAGLQHLRCPRDVSQPNIFHPEDPESSKIIPSGSDSASSSKGKGKGKGKLPLYEVDTLLSGQAAALTLGDSSAGPSIQQPETSCGKRKAVSMKDYLQTKPQKLFRDSDYENPFVPGSRRVSQDFDWTSFPGNVSSGSRVAGFMMDTHTEGHGVFPCQDGMAEMDWEWNSEI